MSFSYLASPYTHEDEAVVQERYIAVLYCVSDFIEERHWVYSPILHCHDMAKVVGHPTDFEFWEPYDLAMIDASDGVIVLMLPGWELSRGVAREIQYCLSINKPVRYIRHELWRR
jgi:hypothetical protein